MVNITKLGCRVIVRWLWWILKRSVGSYCSTLRVFTPSNGLVCSTLNAVNTSVPRFSGGELVPTQKVSPTRGTVAGLRRQLAGSYCPAPLVL
jgi:hypothetical protein